MPFRRDIFWPATRSLLHECDRDFVLRVDGPVRPPIPKYGSATIAKPDDQISGTGPSDIYRTVVAAVHVAALENKVSSPVQFSAKWLNEHHGIGLN